MAIRKRPRRLVDAYTFPGFRPQARVGGIIGDPKARMITIGYPLSSTVPNILCSALVHHDRRDSSLSVCL